MDNREYWSKEKLKSEMEAILSGRHKTHENCKYYLTMQCCYYKSLPLAEIRKKLVNTEFKELKKMKNMPVCSKWCLNK